MAHFTLTETIAADPDTVFSFMVDPARMPRWLPATEAIESVSGSLAEAGATFLQRGAPGLRRPGGVVAADRPRSWRLRLVGGGERADLVFTLQPAGTSTRLRLDADVRNGPALLSPLIDLFSSRLDQRIWRGALGHVKAEIERAPVSPEVGALYSLRGGGMVRLAQVIAADETHVHLRLFQRPKLRKESVDAGPLARTFGRPKDHIAIRPLEPTLRATASLARRGSSSLLADGGFGVPHFPVTITEFQDSEPHRVGQADLSPEVSGQIDAWRSHGSAAFGEVPAPRVGAYFTVALQAVGVDGLGFGVVKLLLSQFRGVHVRLYSNTYAERPTAIDERTLELQKAPTGAAMETPPSGPLGVGHLPLSHGTFASWRPQFFAMVLVDPEELRGYEMWKLAKGGFF